MILEFGEGCDGDAQAIILAPLAGSPEAGGWVADMEWWSDTGKKCWGTVQIADVSNVNGGQIGFYRFDEGTGRCHGERLVVDVDSIGKIVIA